MKLKNVSLLGLILTLLANCLQAATIVVNSTADPAGYNEGITIAQLGSTVTFRDAFNAARNEGGAQTVTFASGLAGQTIYLSQRSAGDSDSAISMSSTVFHGYSAITIQGLTGSSGVTIASAGGESLRFYAGIDNNSFANSLAINDLNISGFHLTNGWGGIIQNVSSTLTLNRCTLTGGSALFGGALYNNKNATTTINNCTFYGNSASFQGGALYNDLGQLSIYFCTIVGNTANQAGGLFVNASTPVLLVNTIIANNIATTVFYPDILGAINGTSHHNLTSGGSGSNGGSSLPSGNGNIIGANADVMPLGNYGGPTLTMAVNPTSAATRAGIGITGYGTDQRGVTRPQSGAVDIGAYYSDANILATSLSLPSQITYPYGQPITVTATASYTGNTLPISGSMTFVLDGATNTVASISNPGNGTSGTAQFTPASSLVPGTYTAQARFTPNNYALPGTAWVGSSASMTVVVTQAVPTIVFGQNSFGYDSFQHFVSATIRGSFQESLGNATVRYYSSSDVNLTSPSTAAPFQIGQYIVRANSSAFGYYLAAERFTTLTILDPALYPLVVTTLSDTVNNSDGVTSLREAVSNAIALGGSRTITFDSSLFTSGSATLTINGFANSIAYTGTSGTLTIRGPGTGKLTISGNNSSAIFRNVGNTLIVSDMTLANGRAEGGGGGAIGANGTLTVSNVVFLNNKALQSFSGGAIANYGSTTLFQCYFVSNTASYWGGAVYASGALSANNCTFKDNQSGDVDNTTTLGGAIYANSFNGTRIANCTFYGNTAVGYGGAVAVSGGGYVFEPFVVNCTLLSNTASISGGGVYVGQNMNNFRFFVRNTIIAGNAAPADANLSIYTNSFSPSIAVVTNSLVDVDPATVFPTGLLTNNGGLTPTIAITPYGPAVDTGLNSLVPSDITKDQRGVARVLGAAVDIGAFEVSGMPSVAWGGVDNISLTQAHVAGMIVSAGDSAITESGFVFAPTSENPNPRINGVGVTRVIGSLSGIDFFADIFLTPGTNYSIVAYAANSQGVSYSSAATYYPTEPNSVVVTTTDDVVGNDGVTSLREALAYAQTWFEPPTVTFAPALTAGGPATVLLSTTNDFSQGLTALAITNTINISGPTNGNGITISTSGGNLRHFLVSPGSTLNLTNLTLSGGSATNRGGSILALGNLSINNCTFTANTSAAQGGAVQALSGAGQLTIRNSTFAGNTAAGAGGAIVAGASANAIVNCTIVDNNSVGGALLVTNATATVLNTIVARNFNGATPADIALAGSGSLTVNSSYNFIGNGGSGGLLNGVNNNLVQSLVLRTNRFTLVQRTNLEPVLNLGTLSNNGGPTYTVAPLRNSPVVGHGSTNGTSVDQRGVRRDPAPDIGAYEYVYPIQIPEANSSLLAQVYGNYLRITYLGMPSAAFVVQKTDQLTAPNWVDLYNVSSDATGLVLLDFLPVTGTNGFYRIRTP